MAASSFAYVDDGRDRWERQKGEPAEAHDWFRHWMNDSRRSFVRTAQKFETAAATVRRAAERNRWRERFATYKAHNSAQIQERFGDIAEQALVPFVQAMARLAVHAAQAPLDTVPADRALATATGALRLITEPTVKDLIRIATAAQSREFNVMDLVLNLLEQRHPDAHDDVLDAMEEMLQGTDSPGPGTDGEAG